MYRKDLQMLRHSKVKYKFIFCKASCPSSPRSLLKVLTDRPLTDRLVTNDSETNGLVTMALWVTHLRAKPAAARESALTSLITLSSSPETQIVYVLQGILRAGFKRSLANFTIGTIFKLNRSRFIIWGIVNYWWVPTISAIPAKVTTFSAKIA